MHISYFFGIKRRFCICMVLSFLFYMDCGVADAQAFNRYPHAELPALTGAYGVGTVVLPLVDDTRLEDMTPEPDDYREIMVQVWYPTEKHFSGPTVPYMDLPSLSYLIVESIGIFMQSGQETDTDPSAALENSIRGGEFSIPIVSATRRPLLKRGLQARTNRETDTLIPFRPGWDFENPISTHAIVEAPPAAEAAPFPVLIFSPGFGAFYSEYQSLFENIASHGYVVAAINHPYTSGITVFPDGRMVVGTEDSSFEEHEARHRVIVDDIEFLAARLESLLQIKLGLALNMNEIGFFGHSFGGSAAVEACLELPQGICAINMDGTLRGQNYIRPIDKPVFLMLSQNHLPEDDPTLELAWRNMTRNGFMMHLDGAEHIAFMDLKLMLSQLVPPVFLGDLDYLFGSMDGQRAVQISRECIIAFFDVFLKGAPVETITAIDYPETLLEYTSDIVVDY
jgi:pimeloyl-ACP methyl ester carboxylesterase